MPAPSRGPWCRGLDARLREHVRFAKQLHVHNVTQAIEQFAIGENLLWFQHQAAWSLLPLLDGPIVVQAIDDQEVQERPPSNLEAFRDCIDVSVPSLNVCIPHSMRDKGVHLFEESGVAVMAGPKLLDDCEPRVHDLRAWDDDSTIREASAQSVPNSLRTIGKFLS